MNDISIFSASPLTVTNVDSDYGHLPLGASFYQNGVHFGVYSKQAKAVELCLFDDLGQKEMQRIPMVRDMNDVWHMFLPGIAAGTMYGYRVHGDWRPEWGWWFNPRKLLLDPYAKAISGDHRWAAHLQNLSAKKGPDWHNNGKRAMKSVVVAENFDWQGVSTPNIAWKDLIIYEMHVKGMSRLSASLPDDIKGTYAGLAHSATIDYLKRLGVNAVQLLPVHQHLDDGFLLAKDLTNYWGYNSIGFFAPHPEYSAARDPQGVVNEFKYMVRELHRAGIEVILDVVYNHTAEGDENGPLLFLRGLDNPAYYLLNEDCRTLNYTGTGNTVNAASSPAMRLIMDSLRYWVQEMQVDGFRFDLGATLGRNGDRFNMNAAFFLAVSQDPVLSRAKMIAEPWDIGPDGYQVGGFPKPWHELNGRYRDSVRRYWCGDVSVTAELAKRLCGSQDIFGPGGRGPLATVNFITSHDGFTLRDLWTYNNKHNEANGEGNNDGDSNNHSWNCGVEGETDDVEIQLTRRKLARAMLATVFCSIGVPFVTAGDECWRTQGGNNNAYCQDNEISWLHWSGDPASQSLLDFTSKLVQFRKETSFFRRQSYFTGVIDPITGQQDVAWYNVHGLPMTHESWHDPQTHFFAGLYTSPVREEGMLFLLFNGMAEDVVFPLPDGEWSLVFDTALEPSFQPELPVTFSESVTNASRSVICLRQLNPAS